MARLASWLATALLAACSVELAPLIAEPSDGSRHSGNGGSGVDASLGGKGGGQGGLQIDATSGAGAPSAGQAGQVASAGASSGGDAGSGATGATGGAAPGTGGSPPVQCFPIGMIDVDHNGYPGDCTKPDQDACRCLGCNTVCWNPYDPFAGSDCVCGACKSDPGCSDPSMCINDGMCDPFWEGCVCPDCANHPKCLK